MQNIDTHTELLPPPKLGKAISNKMKNECHRSHFFIGCYQYIRISELSKTKFNVQLRSYETAAWPVYEVN